MSNVFDHVLTRVCRERLGSAVAAAAAATVLKSDNCMLRGICQKEAMRESLNALSAPLASVAAEAEGPCNK